MYVIGSLTGCGWTHIDDAHIKEFHTAYNMQNVDILETEHVALYVDYSTCVANAMTDGSVFFNDMVSVLTSEKIADYYSIKGNSITKENGDKYSLLKSVPKEKINYADIKTAAEIIANGNKEGILLTDGEYFQKSIAKGNVTNPWMEKAIKKWLSRGHEIYVFAEPYNENHNSRLYEKKRYYFIFTDTRYNGNIYDFAVKSGALKNNNVSQYHLTADNIVLLTSGDNNSSIPNENFGCKPTCGNGAFEVQDWRGLSWKNIFQYIANATDDDGNELPNGEPLIEGLTIDRNSGGSCFRINDMEIRVSNITEEYMNFCMEIESGKKPNQIAIDNPLQVDEAEHLFKLDKKEFKAHGNLNLYIDDKNMFDPSTLYTNGDNLLRIEYIITDYQNNFTHKAEAEEMFTFPSIDVPGQDNVSLVYSIRNALADANISGKMKDRVVYTIYVITSKNNL